MVMSTVILKREELYEMVWSVSPVKVAKRFGLTYKTLEEICRRMEIPIPTIGVRYKAGNRKPLPNLSPNGVSELALDKVAFYMPTDSSEAASWSEKDLNVRVGVPLQVRAREIVSKLILIIQSKGLRVSVTAAGEVQVQVDNKILMPTIQDEASRVTSKSRDLLLAIRLEGTWADAMGLMYSKPKFRSHWPDTKDEKLEQRLEEIAETVCAIHRYLKKYREERESSEEKDRLALQEFEDRQGFLRKLETQALNWQRAQSIRLYLAAVESAIKTRAIRKDDNYGPWLDMARNLVSELDPLTGGWSEEAPEFTDPARSSPWRAAKPSSVPWWPVKGNKN